jgi:hypothetical protein
MGWLKAASCYFSALTKENACFLALSQYMTENCQGRRPSLWYAASTTRLKLQDAERTTLYREEAKNSMCAILLIT